MSNSGIAFADNTRKLYDLIKCGFKCISAKKEKNLFGDQYWKLIFENCAGFIYLDYYGETSLTRFFNKHLEK